MDSPPKHLTVLRHAKSSWANPDIEDHDRPLNARGRRAATLVGQHLRASGQRPELVLCSSAARACETLDLLDIATGTVVLIEDQLYGAAANDLIARLRQIPDDVESVLLIGHNPGVEDLTDLLLGGGLARAEKFPTAAAALLELPIRTWNSLQPANAVLHEFVIPRELEKDT